MTEENVHDSPIGWVNAHIADYTASDGRNGHVLGGRPTLLLTVRGRRTGLLRRTGATYAQRGRAFSVTDSNGGSPHTPEWARNLAADPEVKVQVGERRLVARARFLEGPERDAMWGLLLEVDPFFDELQARTSRRFDVIALEPSGQTRAPGAGPG